MTWKPILATAGALILAGCSSYQPSAALTALPTTAEPAPIELTFLERQDGPFAERNYYFQLKIANPYNQPMWYLLPYAGDLPLRQDGMFHSKENRHQPFVGWRYDGNLAGGKGVAVKIEHLGRDRFAAFLLPPKGTVEFAWYHLTAPLNFPTLVCWEASSISLNGAELQHWLPYRVQCDPAVVLPKTTPTPINLDWDEKRMGSRTDYPAEDVLMVLVEIKRKWALPVKY